MTLGRWTLRYHPDATRDIYAIDRGEAAQVTEAIRQLSSVPLPYIAVALELPHTYLLNVGNHVVGYEIIESERVIRILWIS